MQPQPQAELLLKREAAAFLSVSPRQIERLATNGNLEAVYLAKQPNENVAPARYRLSDLDAIRRGQPNVYPRVAGALVPAPQSGQPPKVRNIRSGAALEALTGYILPAAPAQLKPWLDLEAAAAFSGLPAAFLKRIAPVLEQRGDAVDIGESERVHRWRFRREALERPLVRD